jgi:hypothetical protein
MGADRIGSAGATNTVGDRPSLRTSVPLFFLVICICYGGEKRSKITTCSLNEVGNFRGHVGCESPNQFYWSLRRLA